MRHMLPKRVKATWTWCPCWLPFQPNRPTRVFSHRSAAPPSAWAGRPAPPDCPLPPSQAMTPSCTSRNLPLSNRSMFKKSKPQVGWSWSNRTMKRQHPKMGMAHTPRNAAACAHGARIDALSLRRGPSVGSPACALGPASFGFLPGKGPHRQGNLGHAGKPRFSAAEPGVSQTPVCT